MSAITQSRLRDGEPDALAALCQRRGPAVFAYCAQVAGREHAVAATGDAFARFRAAVVAPRELSPSEAEALLRTVTRRAATARGVDPGERVPEPSADRCGTREHWLLSYVEDEFTDEERVQIAAHISSCAACRHVLHRIREGEQAYDEPPSQSLPLRVADAAVGGLVRASPVRAYAGDAHRVRETALRLLIGDQSTRPPGEPRRSPSPKPDRRELERQQRERARQERAATAPERTSQRGLERPAPAERRRRHEGSKRMSGGELLALLPKLLPFLWAYSVRSVKRWKYKKTLSNRRRPGWYSSRGPAWWFFLAMLVVTIGLAVFAALSSAAILAASCP